jgi:hypothetical protein
MIKKSVLNSYKNLLKTRKLVFKHDNLLLEKSLEEIRGHYLQNKNVIN